MFVLGVSISLPYELSYSQPDRFKYVTVKKGRTIDFFKTKKAFIYIDSSMQQQTKVCMYVVIKDGFLKMSLFLW
jgi:hypothetical protein